MTDDQNLDEQVAVNMFGWKWMSWMGTPTHSTPGYPKACRVRQLFSPKLFTGDLWVEFWKSREGRDATGDEALSYRYSSSRGPERVPRFGGSEDILVLEEVRTNWPTKRVDLFREVLEQIWLSRWENNHTPWTKWVLYEPGDYSRAALNVLEVLK